MTTHIALIRGINVGTSKRVAMADLRDALTGLGFAHVRTLLNSGNVVLESEQSPTAVARAVSGTLAGQLGVPAEVIVRSRGQLLAAMAADPFGPDAPNGSKHFLGCLAATPAPVTAERIPELQDPTACAPDRARLIGRQLSLWCPAGLSASAFAKINWDRALGTAVTVRNWNTVEKLIGLAA